MTEKTLHETLLEAADGLRGAAVAEGRDVTPAETAAIAALALAFDAIPQPGAAPTLASRADLERHLRASGLSRSAAKAVAHGGWPSLDPARHAEDLTSKLRAATARLKRTH